MRYYWWIFIGVLGILAGILLVRFMTVPPIQMSMYLLLVLLSLFLLIVVLSRLRGKILLMAGAVSLISIGVGYYAMTSIVLNRKDTREVPALVRKEGEQGDGHTAVIYFTHGEPETYDPIGWLNQFREFDLQGILIHPVPNPAFLYLPAAECLSQSRTKPPSANAYPDG